MQMHGIIAAILPVHILGGVLALCAGYIALYASKGAAVHRKSGMFFVVAMFAMSLSGALMDALDTASVSVNVLAGLITFYFVTTGLLTVRRRAPEPQWLDVAAMVFALALGLLAFKTGFGLIKTGRPETAPMFIFALVAILAAAGDLRVVRARGIHGRARIARHLWRLCFAMWVAAASFFWGPPRRIPDVIRYPAFFPIPVLLPVAVMLLWLWRLRRKRAVEGIASMGTAQA
jgi:uncharacterized membrane protein